MLTDSQIKTLDDAEKRIKSLLHDIQECKNGKKKFDALELDPRVSKKRFI